MPRNFVTRKPLETNNYVENILKTRICTHQQKLKLQSMLLLILLISSLLILPKNIQNIHPHITSMCTYVPAHGTVMSGAGRPR